MAENYAHINLSKLPAELRTLAESWRRAGARVAARTDDAGEWRIMKMRPNEAEPWVGWYGVDFNG